MMRIANPLIALLLCGTALAGCASDNGGIFGSSSKTVPITGKIAQTDAAGLPTDIESGVQQARQQRLAGRYDDAIHILSQMMLVASDDPRVIGEYGKTLAEKGRAQDAVQFLSRATELQPSDWSLYSALGVAYDQVGDQASARTAYEHALKLKPNDPSVLNNYALSRMMANDPATARQLIARAQSAGGASDPKIARNIALVDKLAPEAVAQQKAAAASMPTAAPASAPAIIASQPLPPAAQNASAKPAPQHPAPQVVMQTVPADPLAGPVKSATHAPATLASHATVKAEARDSHTPSEKSATVASASKSDAKDEKKAALVKTDTKTAKAASVAAKPVSADTKAVKAADAKSDTKSDAKGAAKSKIPALRQTASAY